jgi:acyl-coenzyme A synthetase/AMP-(fatty) acid ligase
MITERIFHWAKQTPYNTAVIQNGAHLSYRSFARSIAKARGYFISQGFSGPGRAVLAVHSMKDFWILGLALRSLGLTTLAARSVAALNQLSMPGLRLVVTLPTEAWPELEDVCAARGLPLLSASLEGEASIPLDAADAYHPPGGHIVWTSGTTGADKMLLLRAEYDSIYFPINVKATGMDQKSVLCMFGISGWTTVGYRWPAGPWTVGGATLFRPGSERYPALRHPGLTHAFMNPAMLASVLAAPADGFPRNDALQLFVGGGAMTRAQVYQAKARITPHVFNYLAATEVGVIAVTPLDTPDDHRWHRPVPSRLIEVVDDSGRPAPAGESGLLRVGTIGGPTSYIDDEAATLTFFKDGFFYPGDLAVMRSDGRIALQGRLTEVINVRGKKISPAPIEDRLAEMFQVNAVCLFSQQNEDGEEELHVVLEAPAHFEPGLVADALREFRGFNKAIVHFVAEMPRNPTGKVVRREAQSLARSNPGHTVQW